jgi:phage tail sheath protein FI
MPATYLHPGVYIEEVPGGARPIEAVGTSTAAFVGMAERGPIDEARFITNFTEFQQTYGGYLNDEDLGASYLAYSVFHFFQNGGTACYVVRVEKDAKTAGLELETSQGVKTITIQAISPGAWGNGLRIAIKRPGTTAADGFNMYVFMKDEMVEAYEDLSMVDTSTAYVDRVTKRSLYIRTQSEDLPDNPTFIGKKDLTGKKPDLSKVYNIKLQVDTFGPYTIDCSAKAVGAKSAVDPQEICDAINAAFLNDVQGPVADVYTDLSGRQRIRIQSPKATADSKIVFTQPDGNDATEDIFGLVESSWEIKSDDVTPENLAMAYGRQDLSSSTTIASPNNIIFQNPTTGADLSPVDVSGSNITIWDIVKKFNDATLSGQPLEPLAPTGRKLAWTDGRYLLLKTDKDIRIRRTAADKPAIEKIFGTGFYAHTFIGSGTNPAKITGKALGSFPTMTQDKNYMRIKVDTSPTIVVDLNGTTSFEDVAERINDKFHQETKKKVKIAEVKTTGANKQLVLASGSQGDSSRLVLLNSIDGEDAAIPLLLGNEADITPGTGTTKQDYFLIVADKPLRAMLKSESPNLASDFTGRKTSVLGKGLRFTVDERTIEIEGSETSGAADLKALFTALSGSGKEALRQKLLIDGAANIDFVPFVTGAKTYLRFSIPLLGTGTAQESDVHAEALAKDTIKAYRGIFGDNVSVFQGPSKELTAPMYTYEYGLPDNNPDNTVLMSGEEMDFSQSLALSGGSQNRSSEGDIKNLTIGSVAGVTSGLRLLDKLTDISLLVIPGWERMSKATAKAFTDEGTTYCDKVRPAQARPLRDLFFITNTPVEVTDPVAAKNYVMNEISYKSSGGYEAIYYPWIEVNDPIGTKSTSISIPPAGSVAGLYASIDGRRGVWKAPAGTEAGVAGVVKLADQVNDIKQDLLNPFGVNAIRKMPGSGIVSWGARTLCTNPEWKYIPVRRTAIMLEVSIYEGIQWAVFEPNDEPLWSLLRLNIGAFMMNLFRSGAFQGSTPEEAFFVKCDKETTTQVEIDLGKVIILVGFAPLKPAEFVIVRISQKAGQKE